MSRLCVEVFFCLALPKNLVGEPFCVSQTFWYRKFYGKEEGREGGREGGREYQDFPSKRFLSPVSKKFVGGSFSPSFISVIGKSQL